MATVDYAKGWEAPAGSAAAVVPSDTTDLDVPSRALWVGGAGNVEVILANDSAAVVLSAVPAGTLLPIRAKRVKAGSTTATLIVALY